MTRWTEEHLSEEIARLEAELASLPAQASASWRVRGLRQALENRCRILRALKASRPRDPRRTDRQLS